jgi:hypothetical protein
MHFRQIEPSGQPGDNPLSTLAAGSLAAETSAEGVKGGWIIFSGNDKRYLLWISKHPSGYVVNAERNPKPSYLKLHGPRASRYRHPPGQALTPSATTSRSAPSTGLRSHAGHTTKSAAHPAPAAHASEITFWYQDLLPPHRC